MSVSRPPASEEPQLPGPDAQDAQEATGEGAMRQAHKQAARAWRPNDGRVSVQDQCLLARQQPGL